MQRNIRVILKTARPMDSDYRVRSILITEDEMLLSSEHVHSRKIEGLEISGDLFIKDPYQLETNESIIDMSLDFYRLDMFVTTNTIDRMLIQNTDPIEHIDVDPDRGFGQRIRVRHLVMVSQ